MSDPARGYSTTFAVDDECGRVVAAPSDPMTVARQFVAERLSDARGATLLRNHRGDFYAWTGICWPELEDRRVRADLYEWLEGASYECESKGETKLAPWQPTRHKIANVVEALQAITHLDALVTPPAWLDDRDVDATSMIPVANGLLDLGTRELLPHTPSFYSQHALSFEYDPDAPRPKRWLAFQRELWEDDDESIEALAELFGYVLSGETNLQKIFALVGPKRSGKGTIGRVLTGLLGAHNTAAPTLSGLTSNFGLSPLIAKPLAVISDARLSSRADSSVAVERLLSISGEDSITIDRKFKPAWTGKLPTRFLILTNELPRFADASGALASRFVLLVLRVSFYDREDPRLTETLIDEAPGIFNWALAGLDRLRERGHFVQPTSAQEAVRHLEDLSSPIGAFVRDTCRVGPALEVDKDVLFAVWKTWCEEEGRSRPGSKAVFVRDLRAVVPGVTPTKPRDGDARRRMLQGLDLLSNEPPPRSHGRLDFSDNNRARPRTTPDQPPSGARSDSAKTAQSSGGPGWSGVGGTTDSVRDDDVDAEEIERLADVARDAQREDSVA
jgi:putative DNA primase/helicase